MRTTSVLHELTVVVSGMDKVLILMEVLLSSTDVTASHVGEKCVFQ